MRSDALRRISAVSGRGAPGAVTTVQVSPQHGSDQLGVCVVSLSVNYELLHVLPDPLHSADAGSVEDTSHQS